MNHEKIKRFVSDKVMCESVRQAVLDSFLNRKAEQDVHVLAAKSLAIEMLQQAWRDLERYRTESEVKSSPIEHV